jgi:hypothetical protein
MILANDRFGLHHFGETRRPEQVTLLGTPDAREAYRRLTCLGGEPRSGGGLVDCVVDCLK